LQVISFPSIIYHLFIRGCFSLFYLFVIDYCPLFFSVLVAAGGGCDVYLRDEKEEW
jgi:hypothetical protein